MAKQFDAEEVVKFFTQNFSDPTLSHLRINGYPVLVLGDLNVSRTSCTHQPPPQAGQVNMVAVE
jgi:hypothetical protein